MSYTRDMAYPAFMKIYPYPDDHYSFAVFSEFSTFNGPYKLSELLTSVLTGATLSSGFAAFLSPLFRLNLLTQASPELVIAGKLPFPYRSTLDTLRDFQNRGNLKIFYRGAPALAARTMIFSSIVGIAGVMGVHFELPQSLTTPYFLLTGIGAIVASHPFSLIYTRMAVDVPNTFPFMTRPPQFLYGAPPTFQRPHMNRAFFYRSSTQCFRRILRSEGISGLFRGVTPSVGAYCAVVALYAIALKMFGGLLKDPWENRSILGVAGALTTVMAAPFIVYPFHTVAHRMMMTTMSGSYYTTPRQCLARIIRTETWPSLFRGVFVSAFFCSQFKQYPEAEVMTMVRPFIQRRDGILSYTPSSNIVLISRDDHAHRFHE